MGGFFHERTKFQRHSFVYTGQPFLWKANLKCAKWRHLWQEICFLFPQWLVWNDELDLKTNIKRWWELSHGKKASLGPQGSESCWLNPWGKMDSSMKAAVCSQTPFILRMSQRHKWHCCCLTRYWQRSQWNSSKPYNFFPDLEFVVLTISSWTPQPGPQFSLGWCWAYLESWVWGKAKGERFSTLVQHLQQ